MATSESDGQLLDARPGLPIHPLASAASILYNLIHNTVVADTSPGVNVIGFSRGSLELTGGATAVISVQLQGSCSLQNPDIDGSTWSELGSAVTAKGITPVTFAGVRWIRAVQTGTPTGGALNVNFSAVGP